MRLALIFILATVIRLYNASVFPSYSAEIAQHYLEIIKLLQGNLLLNGPLTSHPWLRLGAIPYYLFFPVFWIARFHPLTLFYSWTVVEIAMVFFNYYVVKKILNERIALLSTLFLSLSPLQLLFNRTPGFYSFVIPLIYVLLLLLSRTVRKKSAPFWPIFLIVGFMINLHVSSLFLILFFILLGIYLKKFSRISIVASLLAFIIPNVYFFINDYLSRFSMTRNLLIWFPYKVFNFFSGKTLGVNKVSAIDETMVHIVNFFKTVFFPPYSPLVFGVFIISLLLVYLAIKKSPFIIRILSFWLLFGIVALIIHKNPPLHYFVPIFILPIILISYIFSKLLENKRTKLIVSAFILFIIVSNVLFIFSSQYLFQKQKRDLFTIPYPTQERIARTIIRDAGDKKYSLSRIGPFDNYANEFKENYEYLLWWLGNRPVEKSHLKYMIVEDKNRFQNTTAVKSIAEINGVLILRKN